MTPLALREFHQSLNARFAEVNGLEVVAHYGDALAEHDALCNHAGVLDLSFRSRLCLTGADRQKFLNGQVTNNVKDLKTGQGCYAALITAKGRMESDLNIYCLADELLLDFEPGWSPSVAARLEKFVIVEDVQVVDAAPHYGLLSVQGPKAEAAVAALGIFSPPPPENVRTAASLPGSPFTFTSLNDSLLGQIYLMNQPRAGSSGFDLFVPIASLGAVADKLVAAAKSLGGRACGWDALELARVEAGIPRFGADMDETTLPPEAGLDARAISYSKGCYIGQEVIARVRTYGQVARTLRGLRLADDLKTLPAPHDKLFKDDREAGFITSAVASPALKANLALAYVRREANQPGTQLTLRTSVGESTVTIVALPFTPPS